MSYVLADESSCLGATPTAHAAALRFDTDSSGVHWDITLPKDGSEVSFPRLEDVLEEPLPWDLSAEPQLVAAVVYAVPAGAADAVFYPIPVTAPEWAERQPATAAVCRTRMERQVPIPISP